MSGQRHVERSCERARAHLPALADGTLAGWRRRLLGRHLAGCAACAGELQRQETIAEGLRGLGDAAPAPQLDPPDELLDEILDRVHDPGIRARVAAPARGAVSGARPELSVAAALIAALLAYLLWRAARRLTRGFSRAR